MNTELTPMNIELVVQMAIEAGFNPVNVTGSNLVLFEQFAKSIIKKCIEIDIENPDARPGLEIANYFGVDL